MFCVLCSAGIYHFETITDPIELWSSPTSEIRKEMDYYESHFMYVSAWIKRSKNDFELVVFLLFYVICHCCRPMNEYSFVLYDI